MASIAIAQFRTAVAASGCATRFVRQLSYRGPLRPAVPIMFVAAPLFAPDLRRSGVVAAIAAALAH